MAEALFTSVHYFTFSNYTNTNLLCKNPIQTSLHLCKNPDGKQALSYYAYSSVRDLLLLQGQKLLSGS